MKKNILKYLKRDGALKSLSVTSLFVSAVITEDTAKEMEELQLCICNTQSPCFPTRHCRIAIVHSQHISHPLHFRANIFAVLKLARFSLL